MRKTILVLGMLTGLMVFGAVFTTDRFSALLWITISLCGLAAAAPAGWSIPPRITPVPDLPVQVRDDVVLHHS
jgi:hypothetical protein